MPADELRTKLKALVEEWRWNARNERIGWPEAAGLLYAADRLEDAILNSPEIPDGCAALLAESEVEPCAEWRHCEHEGEDGHIFCDVLCADCGMRRDAHPDCEAKAKHPEAAFISLAGIDPDFTGGLDSAEFTKTRWNGAPDADCEAKAKAKLPLGHPFGEWREPRMDGSSKPGRNTRCNLCGQSRSAHELDKGEGGTP